MYTKISENRKKELEKKKRKKAKISAGENSAQPEPDSCFSMPGIDAGAGLSLCLDDVDDDTSSEEEEEFTLPNKEGE